MARKAFIILADGEFDHVCETEGQRKCAVDALRKLGYSVRVKTCLWEKQNEVIDSLIRRTKMQKYKIGDKVYVPQAANSVWCGEGTVVKVYPRSVSLEMETGEMLGEIGAFPNDKVALLPSICLI
ncbi:MAG: hypothetical protein KJO69_10755 [Gammaproteobacteria bacterium]|nr:hypothetical protein [Gammaproteobacteria bacterium]